MCDIGEYAISRANFECTACDGALTTQYPGASDDDKCICTESTYRNADPTRRGECLPCKEGMRCDVGSDAANLEKVIAGKCDDGKEILSMNMCVIPESEEGYMTLKDEPLRIFLCSFEKHWPWRPPRKMRCQSGHKFRCLRLVCCRHLQRWREL